MDIVVLIIWNMIVVGIDEFGFDVKHDFYDVCLMEAYYMTRKSETEEDLLGAREARHLEI